MTMSKGHLLADDEPPPVLVEGLDRCARFLICVDHASARIPRRLGDLGLPAAELARHVAWDIGALAVARLIAKALDAPLVAQNYSRLVIDCNRDPKVPSSIPAIAEYHEVTGNLHLSLDDSMQRRIEIFEPYHATIRAILDERKARGADTILIAQHSMTDRYKGSHRPMHAAVLYNRDRRFAGLVLDALRQDTGVLIADNEPYFVSDETDYTVPVHAEARGLPYVEIELRQDLVSDQSGQHTWANYVIRALRSAERSFIEAYP
jgi:predicted N-formylglutamate amidohydrolase